MSKKVNPKVKAGCGVISIFSLGCLTGIITLFVIIIINVNLSENWKTRESKDHLANHFAKKLNLTDEQRVKFQPIVDELLERKWEERRKYIEQDYAIIENEFLPRLSEFLSDKQKAKAQKIIINWKRDDASKLKK